jgi:hypothetical protein
MRLRSRKALKRYFNPTHVLRGFNSQGAGSGVRSLGVFSCHESRDSVKRRVVHRMRVRKEREAGAKPGLVQCGAAALFFF